MVPIGRRDDPVVHPAEAEAPVAAPEDADVAPPAVTSSVEPTPTSVAAVPSGHALERGRGEANANAASMHPRRATTALIKPIAPQDTRASGNLFKPERPVGSNFSLRAAGT